MDCFALQHLAKALRGDLDTIVLKALQKPLGQRYGTADAFAQDIERYLHSGRLVALLPQYHTPNADIYAVYPQRHQASARVRAFVDFVALSLSRATSPTAG